MFVTNDYLTLAATGTTMPTPLDAGTGSGRGVANYTIVNQQPLEENAQLPKRSKRARSQKKKPEDLLRELIKMGKVRVVRRKGKPPLIQWL